MTGDMKEAVARFRREVLHWRAEMETAKKDGNTVLAAEIQRFLDELEAIIKD
jgi:hypothetical protein